MTKNEIIAMAREAGFETHDIRLNFPKELERFAALVAAAEREACAQACESIYYDPKGNDGYDAYYTRPYLGCAEAIRARSNHAM